MGKFSAFMLSLMVIAIGLGVPVASIYFTVHYGFNEVLTGLLSIFAIIGAFVIGIVGIGEKIFEPSLESTSSIEREKLNMLRASQRATLEELDEIAKILKEIRDALKEVQEVE